MPAVVNMPPTTAYGASGCPHMPQFTMFGDMAFPSPDIRLLPYATVNDPLPDHLLPVLDDYLRGLGDSVTAFTHQVAYLEQLLSQSRANLQLFQAERGKWVSLKGIRTLPLEIVSQIISRTLEAMGNEEGRTSETSPANMTALRLVCKQWDRAAVTTPHLWRSLKCDVDRLGVFNMDGTLSTSRFVDALDSIARWFKRAGRDPSLRLAILGSRMDVSPNAFKLGLLGILGPSLAFKSPVNWQRWYIDSTQFRHGVASQREGLPALLAKFDEGTPLSPRNTTLLADLFSLKQLTIFDWREYGLFTPENTNMFALESLFLAATHRLPNAGFALVPFDAHLPVRLRFLHLHGPHRYPLEAIFRLTHLEEVIISANGTCSFDISTSDFIINTSVRRLVLEGWGVVRNLTIILGYLTLPSISLLRLGCTAPHPGLHSWTGDDLRQFLKRSSPSHLQLSMEDSCKWSGVELGWIIQQCAETKISKLSLDRINGLFQDESLLQLVVQTVKTIACRKSPTAGTWRMGTIVGMVGLDYSGPRVTVYLPKAEEGKVISEAAARVFEVQYLVEPFFSNIFDHGIQGHEYGSKYISPAFIP